MNYQTVDEYVGGFFSNVHTIAIETTHVINSAIPDDYIGDIIQIYRVGIRLIIP